MGPFGHPRRGCPDTPIPTLRWGRQPAGQHPWGLAEGLGGGCTPWWVPLAGGCGSGEQPGAAPPAPPTPLRAAPPIPAPPPPDKRLKVRLCQLPSRGRVGGVTVGRGPAPCPPRPPTAPPAPRRQHRRFPGVPGRRWHRAPQQQRGGDLDPWSQHRRVATHQKMGGSNRKMMMAKAEGSGLTFNARQGPEGLRPWQSLGTRDPGT